MTRLLGRIPAWLPLTAPDPGPRPRGFLTRGRLVTATSGSPNKFAGPYAFGYAETVAVILGATGGWHVHIGPLDTDARARIDRALADGNLPPDRFVHVPWTPSVALTLWEQACDVYCASFPIDGARARIEALASATPYLHHSTTPDVDPSRDEFPAGLVWRTWADLSATLQRLSHVAALEEQSAAARAEYDRTHHPAVFVEILARILEGGSGASDPLWRERSDAAIRSLLRSLSSAMIHDTSAASRGGGGSRRLSRRLREGVRKWLSRG